jgi:F-type H+-transporting ATPase subunit b
MSPSVDMNSLNESVNISTLLPMPPTLLAVTVDFDKSVFLMMALFALLIVVLKPLLLDPMLRVFALREERIDGARAEARGMQERAAEILRNYEAQVAKVRAEAVAERDAQRRDTARLEAEILAEGREAVEAITREGRLHIEADVAKLERELSQSAGSLAKEIGSRVLGREVA